MHQKRFGFQLNREKDLGMEPKAAWYGETDSVSWSTKLKTESKCDSEPESEAADETVKA